MFLIPFIVGVIIVAAWYAYLQKYEKYFHNIPGPKTIPILGNLLLFTDSSTLLLAVRRLFDEYGSIVRIWLSAIPVVILADYDAIEKVLSSTRLIEKSDMYRFMQSWLGTGLLNSKATKWKTRRRLITPTYHFQILEQFVPTFDRIGGNLVSTLRRDQNKASIDIYQYITLSTLDIICETAMGVPVNALSNRESPYVRSVKQMCFIVMDRVFHAAQLFDVTYRFTENYRTEQKCLKVLHSHTMSVIRKRREELQNTMSEGQEEQEDRDEVGARKRVAFLDLLLQATDNGVPLTDEDVREEVDTFMFEGHDTTASGISFALYEIAQNPHVQSKIYEEQLEIFGGEQQREATYQDLMNMKYLELVIKETLRLYPSVPFYGRQVTEDVELGQNMTLPKGTTIGVMAFQIHKDPKYYPNPEKFDPDRWLPEKNTGNRPYSFVPFSAGPRNCIGQKFAYLEMKSTISKLVQNFELMPVVPAHRLQLVTEVILKSANGILIGLKERHEVTHL